MYRHACKLIKLLITVTIFLLVAGCSLPRGYEALLVLSDLEAGPGDSRLKATTAPPVIRAVTYRSNNGEQTGDLYVSGRPRAGIVLLPGAAEEGKDDPRVRSLASTLARSRFAVFVPDLQGFRSLKVSRRDIDETAAAFQWLASQPVLSPQGRAGILAFSYASGPAILASLRPGIAERVKFLMTVGGYYDLVDVLVFFTTGYFRDENGRLQHREPNRYGKWVFVASNLQRLSDPMDRQLFSEAAERKLKDLEAPLDDLVARLGPEGRRFYQFIENRDPTLAVTLIERLPRQVRDEIEALDVSKHDLGGLKAKMIIVHGYEDDIIPYAGSVALARAMGRKQARLFLVHGLMHVDLEPGLPDKVRMWMAVADLLRQRGE